MNESSKSKIDVPLETSLPEGAVSLESILCTEELRRRPSRPADYEKENRALVALRSALADSPRTILQTLAETILEVTQSDSSGLSLLTKEDGGKRFYWPAIAGKWKPHIGGGTPRDFGPCGDVLDRNTTLLFRHFERRYPYLLPVAPSAEECLLVPFYVEGKAVGTIWAIMHDNRHRFDAEDGRIMSSLGKFASSAYQSLELIEDLKLQVAEREKTERALRDLTNSLETRVRVRTEELEQEIAERKRAERRLVAQYRVTQILAETASLEEATPKILQALCECLVWDLGELWRIDRVAGVLRGVEVWHKPSVEVPRFEAISRDLTFLPGIGLPGRVWSSREPAYIPDVVQDSNFQRASIAASEGLHAAFAFPILLGSEVVGTMDFFSQEIRQPDRDLLDMMATIGSQIGQFIERKRAEEELRRSEVYLAEAQRLSVTGSFGWKMASGEIVWSEETYRLFTLDRTMKPTVEFVLSRTHPEDRDSVQQLIDRVTREGKDWDLEHRIVMPDGAVKHLHVVAHAVHDELTGATEYVGAVMDVTAVKESRQALEKAYAKIQALKDELQKENIVLREEIDRSSMFEEIVGSSPALQTVLSRMSKVAPTDSSVLITGETGTGKELVARAIHRRSHRSSRAFVTVNCAAIPRDLIASELFGHEKGAFTGAIQQRLGRFELAGGGTIFLDEVGELPAETQIALLRVLQEHEIERVGGNRSIRTDVRVIAATNRDLQAAIATGAFRSDLFYRLNVFPIEIPPLRERREDIPLLVVYFIDRFARLAGKKLRTIKNSTLEMLQSYPWPGNIRELQNVIERSVIVCQTENFSVDESWLSRPLRATESNNRRDLYKSLSSHEKEIIEAALSESGGRVSGPSGAAARLGIPGSTLDSKIRSLKINKNRFKTTDPTTERI